MEQDNSLDFTGDRGGRRQIKDRRFRVAAKRTPDRRTGLDRRSGWDRRYQPPISFKGTDRRTT